MTYLNPPLLLQYHKFRNSFTPDRVILVAPAVDLLPSQTRSMAETSTWTSTTWKGWPSQCLMTKKHHLCPQFWRSWSKQVVTGYRSQDGGVVWFVDVGPYQLLYGPLPPVTRRVPWYETQVARGVGGKMVWGMSGN